MCQMSGKKNKWDQILHEFGIEQCKSITIHVLSSKLKKKNAQISKLAIWVNSILCFVFWWWQNVGLL